MGLCWFNFPYKPKKKKKTRNKEPRGMRKAREKELGKEDKEGEGRNQK